MMGVSGSLPFADGLAGLTAVRLAYHAAGVQGEVQLPVTCTGPPLSLPLSKRRLCSTTRPVAGGQACAAVALSETSRPAFRKCSRMALAMIPAVPRRRLEARSEVSVTVLVWSRVPTRVTLQIFGAFRGSRSNPFSLLSHSKPWLPAFCMTGL